VVEIVANPSKTVEVIQSKDPKANVSLESKRLRLAIDTVINSPDARAEGFGRVSPIRLSTMARQVSSALNTKTMVKADAVWDGSFLPPNSELDLVLKR
jgi:NitT/TauT family transport system substrate-binding protein